MGDAFLWALRRQLLRQADMFDHPEDYRAGVEDTFSVLFPNPERGLACSSSDEEHAAGQHSPAELWLG